MNSRPIQLAIFAGLLAMSVIGFIQLTDYSTRPGAFGESPRQLGDIDLTATSWPADSISDQKPILIVFYHPKCPCTSATVRVLERLHPRFNAVPQITAVAYCPENEPESWIESRTTATLLSLDQTQIVIDRGGRLSEKFGAHVSGHILLYDVNGNLNFSGGITPYRGHEGDCPSSLDLLDRVNSPGDKCKQWPVFGCGIVVESDVIR